MAEDTDFSTFKRNVNRGQVACENKYVDGPRYIYQIHLFSMRWGIFFGPNSTETFNETRARRTMWAQLSEADIADDSGADIIGLGKRGIACSFVPLLVQLALHAII
mmetsp:Transcript_1619/g.4342  ORF Transcript_1619/g.4342 Transcript_1619/m.4342 type:complete len:106 (+) Transcript_1619:421-738(+)